MDGLHHGERKALGRAHLPESRSLLAVSNAYTQPDPEQALALVVCERKPDGSCYERTQAWSKTIFVNADQEHSGQTLPWGWTM